MRVFSAHRRAVVHRIKCEGGGCVAGVRSVQWERERKKETEQDIRLFGGTSTRRFRAIVVLVCSAHCVRPFHSHHRHWRAHRVVAPCAISSALTTTVSNVRKLAVTHKHFARKHSIKGTREFPCLMLAVWSTHQLYALCAYRTNHTALSPYGRTTPTSSLSNASRMSTH